MNACLTMLTFKKEKAELEKKLIKQKFNGN
jgi:hypothetical protein